MKIEKKLTDEQIKTLENTKENYNELLKNLKKSNTIVIPSHIVNMLLEGFKKPQPIILPTVLIAYNSSYSDKSKFQLSTVSYHILNQESHKKYSFPIAHIYCSGHVCMGNIFIPSSISKLTPMYPLEALLQNNDRNFAHGNPSIPITNEKKEQLISIISKTNDNYFKDDKKQLIGGLSQHKTKLIQLIKKDNNNDFVYHDLLWKISNYILVNSIDYKHAKQIMTQIYNIIFP